jgi:hypothetical protein
MRRKRNFVKSVLAGGLLAAAAVGAWAAGHSAAKRPFDVPPSADLNYRLAAQQKGFGLNGEALITWRVGDGKYAVGVESRVPLLGKLSDNRSQGTIDGYGLAPAEFYEKRYRKDPTTTVFNRDSKTITFTDGKLSYPLKGGEQDRVSVTWQLASVARAAGERFKPGSEWTFFVAGRRDGEPWTFKVLKRETVRTGVGEVEAVHVVRAPLPDNKDQTLDIWLAPGKEWYPVKLRFTDNDNESIEQTLEKITKR